MKNRAEAPIFHTAVCAGPKQPLSLPGNCIRSFPARASHKVLGMEGNVRNPHIIIRTDGNSDIATGHIRRCLTIADALKERGAEVRFIVSDAESSALLNTLASSYPSVCLNTPYDDRTEETGIVRSGSDLYSWADLFLVDSYFVTLDYLQALRFCRPVAMIDDLTIGSLPVDLLINYNPDVSAELYSYAGEILAGTAYAPLRPQFAGAAGKPYIVKEKAETLFVSTGGSDPYHIAYLTSAAAAELFPRVDVVCGTYSPDYEALLALSAEHPGIQVRSSVDDMAGLMAEADLAVTAGGTTLYELAAVGVPSVIYSMSDDQAIDCALFKEKGLGFYVGDVRPKAEGGGENSPAPDNSADPAVIRALLDKLSGLKDDRPARQRASRRMRERVDGKGAGRIADALFDLACVMM